MPPKKPPKKGPVASDGGADIPVKYRIAKHLDLQKEAHYAWRQMLKTAEVLIEEDSDLQYKVKKGLRLKQRFLAPEVLGRFYVRYCELINEMYEAYLNSIQLQRMDYIQEIISIIVKRMFELRNELVHLIVNDYIYVDSSLLQLLKTPFDIQVVVPYHFTADSRPGSVEHLLQKMWMQSEKRLKKKAKLEQQGKVPPQAKESKETVTTTEPIEGEGVEEHEKVKGEEEAIEEEEEEEEEIVNVTEESPVFLQVLLIQRHERYRQYAYRAFLERVARYRTYFAKKISESKMASEELKARCVKIIQRFYRGFMEVKRERVRTGRRDVLLGITPDVDRRPKLFVVESTKLHERRRQIRKKIDIAYQKEIDKQKKRYLFFKRNQFLGDITDEIIEWWKEWYHGYGYFPQYPYELEGGSVIVITGQYETIEERIAEDEKIAKLTKGKTKEQLKQERIQEKLDELARKELQKEKEAKEKKALFKARCNPQTDPGYDPKMSAVNAQMVEVLRRYRQSWSVLDKFSIDHNPEIVYGFMEPIIVEDILNDLNLECRKVVDALMRLELKVFIKAQQQDFRNVGWKWPKQRLRKRPKPVPEPKPFIIDDKMMTGIEKVFDLGLISKPTVKLSDFLGDMKYAAYEMNIEDPIAKFPSPGYGDAKRRIVLSCIFGSGLEPGAPRNKSVMLLGIPRNGKSFLVDCTAGEMNAVKLTISPEVLAGKVKRPGKILSQVFQAARVFQPAVIYLRDIERVFYKKVPPAEKKMKAKALKAPLTKLLKAMPITEKVIFIATCSDPTVAKIRPMMKLFTEKILIPWPDYGTIQRFFYTKFQNIKSMPRDYCVQPLAKIMQGFGYGFLIEMFNDIMTPERIVKLNAQSIHPSEFLEYLIEKDIEPMDTKQYEKLMDIYIQYSPLKAEREEYTIINKSRYYVYKKLAEVEKKKAEEKAKKKG